MLGKCFATGSVCVTAALLLCNLTIAASVALGSANPHAALSGKDSAYLNGISTAEWQQCLEFGVDAVNKQMSLENNLLHSQITVENGSISHTLLLDALPSAKAQADNEIAKKILASSQYVYNSKCLPHGISGTSCVAYMKTKRLPTNSELRRKCSAVIRERRNAHSPFRRLLPRHYKDGLYEMYAGAEVPSPLLISSKIHEQRLNSLDDKGRSLAVAQWAQFIAHDLSKPIVTSMSDGSSIECCNKDSYDLQPRHRHPLCAPLLGKNTKLKYGRDTCLNYVRSALAVGEECTFGAVEQLNQATGYLDLSQLYGFTDEAQRSMRTFQNGHIKSSGAGDKPQEDLLPTTTVDSHEYCAYSSTANHSVCFMAGDSRVNCNPFTILIYTIFMRNHNQIANKLASSHSDWSDDQLYEVAQAINIYIYRRIVFREWLPVVLGDKIAASINDGSYGSGDSENKLTNSNIQISNEFAVAAMRFYLSMMPNALHNFATTKEQKAEQTKGSQASRNNDILPEQNVFLLKDQIYKPDMSYTADKLNLILESLLHQRAMKVDATYEDSLILGNTDMGRPTHGDVLALDIQRGRDHGLQGYTKYLELCTNTKVNDWRDLEKLMTTDVVNQLKSIYQNYSDIDLIIGGISELPLEGSAVGPTFTCILAEQFSQIQQAQNAMKSTAAEAAELQLYKSAAAIHILCGNSDLKNIPANIFHLVSEINQLLPCEKYT